MQEDARVAVCTDYGDTSIKCVKPYFGGKGSSSSSSSPAHAPIRIDDMSSADDATAGETISASLLERTRTESEDGFHPPSGLEADATFAADKSDRYRRFGAGRNLMQHVK